MSKKIICVDFDGVLHSYSSGWKGVGMVVDEPVPGAIDWLTRLVQDGRFKVCIYSARRKDAAGISAMRFWLLKNGIQYTELDKIDFAAEKQPAHLTIDDRAVCFTGEFPKLDEVADFKPWNKL